MAQVTSPDGAGSVATAQFHTNQDFTFFHDPLAICFHVIRVAPTLGGHVHIIQKKFDAGLIQIVYTCISHGCKNTPQVGVAGKKSSFNQGRMGNGVGYFAAFFDVFAMNEEVS